MHAILLSKNADPAETSGRNEVPDGLNSATSYYYGRQGEKYSLDIAVERVGKSDD